MKNARFREYSLQAHTYATFFWAVRDPTGRSRCSHTNRPAHRWSRLRCSFLHKRLWITKVKLCTLWCSVIDYRKLYFLYRLFDSFTKELKIYFLLYSLKRNINITLLDLCSLLEIYFARCENGLLLDTSQSQLPVYRTAPAEHSFFFLRAGEYHCYVNNFTAQSESLCRARLHGKQKKQVCNSTDIQCLQQIKFTFL